MIYEIYVKPDSGPCSVQERDTQQRWAWSNRNEAIQIARDKKTLYPHMNFVVHELKALYGPRSVVFDTSNH